MDIHKFSNPIFNVVFLLFCIFAFASSTWFSLSPDEFPWVI